MDLPYIYKDKDININCLLDKKIGIVGFGNQGKAQSLNLRDSGIDVKIGIRNKSSSISLIKDEGLDYNTIDLVVSNSDIIAILVPDQKMSKIFSEYIEPYLKEGQILLFSHGYNIHYRLISPPDFVSTVLVAPSGAGTELRRQYLNNSGIPGLFAIYKNNDSKFLKDQVLAYCRAIGLSRAGVVESSFKEETETDLFGEQSVLTSSIPMIVRSSYNVLLESGYSPAVSWLVCYYELKTIVDMFHSKGLKFMHSAISNTAEYGGMTRGRRIIDNKVINEMRKIIKEIQSGQFHEEWMNEHSSNYPILNKLRKDFEDNPIEKISKYMLKEILKDQ